MSDFIPIFPLPNVVLFPNVFLPLHIFEPRYREMVGDALAGDRMIGMTLLKPGWEHEYEGRPPVYATGGNNAALTVNISLQFTDDKGNRLTGTAQVAVNDPLPPSEGKSIVSSHAGDALRSIAAEADR